MQTVQYVNLYHTSQPASLHRWTPLQPAYCPKCSTEDAISTALHSVITHLDHKVTSAAILYIDVCPAFYTIIPQRLTEKLHLLGLDVATCL